MNKKSIIYQQKRPHIFINCSKAHMLIKIIHDSVLTYFTFSKKGSTIFLLQAKQTKFYLPNTYDIENFK